MKTALLYSLGCSLLAALLEGLFAGSGIRQRLKELRSPPYTLPFAGWIVIGALYYAICFAILYRLFLLPALAWRNAALLLAAGLMSINAFWNYFFFRTRNLRHACLLGLAYNVVAVSLFLVLLCKVDRPAAWWLLPYLFYLLYANVWTFRVWKLNRDSANT